MKTPIDSLSITAPYKILVAEDDLDQARLLCRWLQSRGDVEATHVANGASAATLATEREWDLIISDIELPEVDGLEVLRRSKEAYPRTPMLLVTAHQRLDFALRAIEHRVDDLILKPLQRDDLLSKAGRLLARRSRDDRHTVVAVGAHPDDVEIGCGGILAQHRDRGDRIVILTLSVGEQGGAKYTRMIESERAAKLLGAELVWGGLRDTCISEGQESISVIEDVIRSVQPGTVYTHTAWDAHQDHRNTHRATVVAARGVSNLLCYQSPSTTVKFQPTQFVDITQELDVKLAAIGRYESQVAARPYLTPSLVRATAEYWGRFANYKLVEPFEVIRSMQSAPPARARSARRRERSSSTSQDVRQPVAVR